jgi:hypothetical protein
MSQAAENKHAQAILASRPAGGEQVPMIGGGFAIVTKGRSRKLHARKKKKQKRNDKKRGRNG